MSETEAVLFDAAGTLFDLEPDLATRLALSSGSAPAKVQWALSRVNDRGGWPEDQPDRAHRLAAWTGFLHSILADIGTGTEAAAAIAEDIVDPRSYQLFPETLSVLDLLAAQGVPCAIVSNFDGLLVEILDQLGIRGRFAAVVYSGEVGAYKPDARIFARATTALGVSAERTVMIGDSPYSDIGGARAFGLRAILIDRTGRYAGHDGEVATSLAELPSLLFGARA